MVDKMDSFSRPCGSRRPCVHDRGKRLSASLKHTGLAGSTAKLHERHVHPNQPCSRFELSAPRGDPWSRVQQVWVRGVDGSPAIATISVRTGNYDCLCRFPTFPQQTYGHVFCSPAINRRRCVWIISTDLTLRGLGKLLHVKPRELAQ
eukprot:COSAG01_NODE_4517_length_4960_cov_3.538984_2_plen_148_part_00